MRQYRYNIGDYVKIGGAAGTVVMQDFQGYYLVATSVGWDEKHHLYGQVPEEIREKHKRFWMISEDRMMLLGTRRPEQSINSPEMYPIWN